MTKKEQTLYNQLTSISNQIYRDTEYATSSFMHTQAGSVAWYMLTPEGQKEVYSFPSLFFGKRYSTKKVPRGLYRKEVNAAHTIDYLHSFGRITQTSDINSQVEETKDTLTNGQLLGWA